MGRNVRCVAFDAVGTLIFPQPSVSQAYWDIGRSYGSQLSLEVVRRRFSHVFNELATGIRKDYSTSETEERQRWFHIVQAVLSDVEPIEPCFEALHHHFAQPSSWRCFPDVQETLETLHARGVSLIVASNFDERLNGLCDALPELRFLQRRIISATIGWHKPSQSFYARLIQEADCDPEHILMVGDDVRNDVLAARDAGLQAMLIHRDGTADPSVLTDLRQLLPKID